MSYVRVEVLDASNATQRYARALESIPRGLETAQYRAMKRAGERANTEAGRFAAAKYQINKGQFQANVTSKIQGLGTAMLTISFCGTVIPLKEFRVSTSSKGVYAKAKQGGGNIARAFIDEKLGGGVYERKGKSRLPIEQKYGPATAQMMNDDDIKLQMDETIGEEYEKRMEHEVQNLLAGV